MPFQNYTMAMKMTRYLLLLLVYIFSIHADEGDDLSTREVALSSESEPIAVIAGCVNAVTGALFQVETDLVGNTIDPIKIVRFYDSQSKSEPSLGLGSSLQFPILASDYQKGARHSYALIAEKEGGYLTFQGDYSSHSSSRSFHVDSRLSKNGYTHGGGIKSGAHIFSRSAELNGDWVVKLEDGTVRKYVSKFKLTNDAKKRLRFPTQDAYILKQETKPNGNIVKYEYHYKDNIPYISKITTYNRDASAILNEVNISSLSDGYSASSSCGQQVIYKIRKHHGSESDRTCLSYISTTQFGHTSFGYKKVKGSDRPVINTVTKLGGYQQEVEIDDKRRATSIYHSVGSNDERFLTHNLTYEKNFTIVSDCLGKKLTYFFDDYQRVVKVDYRSKENLKGFSRQDIFEWDEKGWLKSKSVRSEKELFHKKTYEYDDRGNVISETVIGNITGNRSTTFLPKKDSETDKYTLNYEYSRDGFNVLLKSRTPEGLIKTYEYVPGTSLKCKEFEIYNGQIQNRIFRIFDLNGEISELIEDDGSGTDINDFTGASFRRETHYKSIKKPGASFGKCEFEEKYYWSLPAKYKELLSKTNYEYDLKGNLIQTKVEDANGAILSISTRKFNEQNRLIEETDPCGHTKCYQYDFNGNRTEEKNLSTGKEIKYSYNSTNHLVRVETFYPGENPHIILYGYDPLGNKVRETDEFGNDTIFKYDLFGNEVSIIYPETSKGLVSSIQKRYNALGQLISKIDERGNETRFSRNIYGQPIRTDYADGSFEVNEYYLSGLLKKKTRSDGSFIFYEYDPKGHLIKKELGDSSGMILSRDQYEYKGDLLKSHKDLSGQVELYSYDGAGRLIKIQLGDKVILYVKDGLGRVVSKIESDRVETNEFDGMDRIVSTRRGDGAYERYIYDAQGNKIEEAREVSNGIFIKRLRVFNPDGTIRSTIDEEGNQTEFIYRRDTKNCLNQSVLVTTKIEPSGRTITIEYDARGRLASEKIYKAGDLLSQENYSYDLTGNLIKTEILVLKEGKSSHSYTIEREYDSLNRLVALIEGKKVTRYEYDSLGRLSKTIQPTKVELVCSYDARDLIISKKSSDGSVEYYFKYDSRGNLIESIDHINKVHLKRQFDLYDRMLEERFPENLTVSFNYDEYDRVTEISMPDQSVIKYSYDAYRLKQVQYKGVTIDTLKYDKLGRLLQLGKIEYGYDDLSRITKIASPTFNAFYGPYDLNGNLIEETVETPFSKITHQFSYDNLNALISEDKTIYSYDSLGNCLSQNGKAITVNKMNQLLDDCHSHYDYDDNGRLIYDTDSGYKYDALGRLVSYTYKGRTHTLKYDCFNRCLSIDDEKLVYFGEKEIASSSKNNLKAVRVVHPEPHNELTFSAIIQGKPYITLQDLRHNVVQLVDSSGLVTEKYDYSVFKEKSATCFPLSPWRYANRRHLENLVLYTHRFYHQDMRRWITPDPLDFEDGYNLYRFVKNNPYRYLDKDGQFAFVIPLVFTFELGASITAISLPTIYTAMAATAAAATYCGIKTIDQKYGTNIAGSLFQQGTYVLNTEQTIELPTKEEDKTEKKPKYSIKTNEKGQSTVEGVYAPDRELPQTKFGVKIPDSDTPHTQLGKQQGSKGVYVKAREFGYDGSWVRDGDFTDHGRRDHPCPHQHSAKENPTGGTQQRDDPSYFEYWEWYN